jgi:hypothetical protein
VEIDARGALVGECSCHGLHHCESLSVL